MTPSISQPSGFMPMAKAGPLPPFLPVAIRVRPSQPRPTPRPLPHAYKARPAPSNRDLKPPHQQAPSAVPSPAAGKSG